MLTSKSHQPNSRNPVPYLKTLCTGLAIGFAGFLLAEAYMMTSDVQWIPGAAGILDRVWLAANGIASATLAYLSMKRY